MAADPTTWFDIITTTSAASNYWPDFISSFESVGSFNGGGAALTSSSSAAAAANFDNHHVICNSGLELDHSLNPLLDPFLPHSPFLDVYDHHSSCVSFVRSSSAADCLSSSAAAKPPDPPAINLHHSYSAALQYPSLDLLHPAAANPSSFSSSCSADSYSTLPPNHHHHLPHPIAGLPLSAVTTAAAAAVVDIDLLGAADDAAPPSSDLWAAAISQNNVLQQQQQLGSSSSVQQQMMTMIREAAAAPAGTPHSPSSVAPIATIATTTTEVSSKSSSNPAEAAIMVVGRNEFENRAGLLLPYTYGNSPVIGDDICSNLQVVGGATNNWRSDASAAAAAAAGERQSSSRFLSRCEHSSLETSPQASLISSSTAHVATSVIAAESIEESYGGDLQQQQQQQQRFSVRNASGKNYNNSKRKMQQQDTKRAAVASISTTNVIQEMVNEPGGKWQQQMHKESESGGGGGGRDPAAAGGGGLSRCSSVTLSFDSGAILSANSINDDDCIPMDAIGAALLSEAGVGALDRYHALACAASAARTKRPRMDAHMSARHCLAERKRREKLNRNLDELRSLVTPSLVGSSAKSDKASIIEAAVQILKEKLKKEGGASNVEEQNEQQVIGIVSEVFREEVEEGMPEGSGEWVEVKKAAEARYIVSVRGIHRKGILCDIIRALSGLSLRILFANSASSSSANSIFAAKIEVVDDHSSGTVNLQKVIHDTMRQCIITSPSWVLESEPDLLID